MPDEPDDRFRWAERSNAEWHATAKLALMHANEHLLIANMAENAKLLKDMARFDWRLTVAKLAALLSDSNAAANVHRLEGLSHLAAAYAEGVRIPRAADLSRWTNVLVSESLVRAEDPPEDVFVSNITTQSGNFRVFLGSWCEADFWLQQLLDLSAQLPNYCLNRVSRGINALLTISDRVAERLGVPRFAPCGGRASSHVPIPSERDLARRTQALLFTPNDLAGLGIEVRDVEPFVFSEANRRSLPEQIIGHTSFERRPLVQISDKYGLALPTAVSAALRRFVLEQVEESGLLPALVRNLARTQATLVARIMDDLGATQRREGFLSGIQHPLPNGAMQVAEFDVGKVAQIVYVPDDVSEVIWNGLTSWNRLWELGTLFAAFLRQCADDALKQPDCSEGMSVVILGGLGRGCTLPLPQFPPAWHSVILSLSDWYDFGRSRDASLLRLYKLKCQETWLQSRGFVIANASGDLNLYAHWEQASYNLVHRELQIGSGHGVLYIPTDSIQQLRLQNKTRIDAHAAFEPVAGKWVPVERLNLDSHFRELSEAPVYGYLDRVNRELLGVVEWERQTWWVSGGTRIHTSWPNDLQYRTWHTIINWMPRLLSALNTRTAPLIARIDVDLSSLQTWPTGRLDEIGTTTHLDVESDAQSRRIRISIPVEFFSLFAREDNAGERTLLRHLAEAVTTLQGDDGRSGLDTVVESILPNSDAKFLHLVPLRSPREEVALYSRPATRFLAEEDLAASQIEVCASTLAGLDSPVTGQDECVKLLNGLVDQLWFRIKATLGVHNGPDVVIRCLTQMEGLRLDQRGWDHTARAVLALYQDGAAVIAAARAEQGRRNAASLSARVLAEMAVSTCLPTSGKLISACDYDRLLADITNLISFAYDSDAIRNALTPSEITIHPNTQPSIQNAFLREIIEPYQHEYFSTLFSDAAAGYTDLFRSDHSRALPEDWELYNEAFRAEFGLSIHQTGTCVMRLHDLAIDGRSCVTRSSNGRLQRTLGEAPDIGERVASAFLDSFSTVPRARWDEAPKGYRSRDWYPWRFRRRLSLLVRPLVAFGTAEDSLLLFSSGLLDDAMSNVINGCFEGRFPPEDFRSPQMQEWIGRATHRRGMRFNDDVASEIRKFDCAARSSVRMTEFGASPELGDVDVLAWNAQAGTVWVIECKALRFAMTVAEISEQLRRFRGEAGDDLAKHLRRSEWLARKANRVQDVTGCEAIRDVRQLVVTSSVVPMSFLQDLPIPPNSIVPLARLRAAMT